MCTDCEDADLQRALFDCKGSCVLTDKFELKFNGLDNCAAADGLPSYTTGDNGLDNNGDFALLSCMPSTNSLLKS